MNDSPTLSLFNILHRGSYFNDCDLYGDEVVLMNKKNKIVKLKHDLANYKTSNNINEHLLEAKDKECEQLKAKIKMLFALVKMHEFTAK